MEYSYSSCKYTSFVYYLCTFIKNRNKHRVYLADNNIFSNLSYVGSFNRSLSKMSFRDYIYKYYYNSYNNVLAKSYNSLVYNSNKYIS